jgi:hypothetical protein
MARLGFRNAETTKLIDHRLHVLNQSYWFMLYISLLIDNMKVDLYTLSFPTMKSINNNSEFHGVTFYF